MAGAQAHCHGSRMPVGPWQARSGVIRRAAAVEPKIQADSPLTKPVPRRICLLVEPSPFTYVCGYMNRYRNTIRYLREAGCEVLVVTPGRVSERVD